MGAELGERNVAVDKRTKSFINNMIFVQSDLDFATGDIFVSLINGGVYQHYDFGANGFRFCVDKRRRLSTL